jgi:hypothetical protein
MDESKQALSAFVTTVSVKAGLIDPHIISGIGPSIRSVSDIDFSDLDTVLWNTILAETHKTRM